MNLYAYVANAPMLYRDPSGRFIELIKNGASKGYDLASSAPSKIKKHLVDHGRVGYIASYGVTDVFSASIDLGSAKLSDRIGDHHSVRGKVAEFREGRSQVKLEIPLIGSVSSTNTTRDNWKTVNKVVEFQKSDLVDLLDGGKSTINISFGVGYVYENSITFDFPE